MVLFIFCCLMFPVEEEHAARPYAILRATSHVIVDPVANSAPWDHAAAAPQARQQSPGTLIRSTISIAAVCACERRAPVQRRAQIMFRNGQLCARALTNKMSLRASDIQGQQTVKRAETMHSTSASGVQSCPMVNIRLATRASSSVLRIRHVSDRPIHPTRLSFRKLAPRCGRCQHCAVWPERLDAELISVDLARRRRRAGKAGGEGAARHRRLPL